jgi:hypothetical protein
MLIEFSLTFGLCIRTGGLGRLLFEAKDATALRVRGWRHRPRGDEFTGGDDTGGQSKANQVLVAGAAHIGHRVVQHEVQLPL